MNNRRCSVFQAVAAAIIVLLCFVLEQRIVARPQSKEQATSQLEMSKGTEAKVAYWKSPMNPNEVYRRPGKDSMGMDLVPVYAGEASSAGVIAISPAVEQDMGVRTSKVIRGTVSTIVHTVGYLDYNEQTLSIVTTKVDGWIDKLFANQTGVWVEKNDPLFELYSPALFSAQEEYLAALRNMSGHELNGNAQMRVKPTKLLQDARTRLLYFDISPDQIAELERSGTVRKTLTIKAPFRGIVVRKNIVQGQQAKAGMELLRLADLRTIWAMVKIYERDLPYVRLGQEAIMTLDYLPGRTFTGHVTFIYPYVEPQTRQITVRLQFDNPAFELKAAMYVSVTLKGELTREATLVPDLAVIYTGLRNVVCVEREPGRFEIRDVKLGVHSEDNYVQVLSGLIPGESVAVSGQFLINSESQIRQTALKFLPPQETAPATGGPESMPVVNQMPHKD